MATGETPQTLSPIAKAIHQVSQKTTAEVRVHLTRRWIERDPYRSAVRVFNQHGMQRTTFRNAVLFYINLRKRRFAIIGDEGIHEIAGREYWNSLTRLLHEDLLSTHPENAIAIAVMTAGAMLQEHFPVEDASPDSDSH